MHMTLNALFLYIHMLTAKKKLPGQELKKSTLIGAVAMKNK